jgi:hypothetical protein
MTICNQRPDVFGTPASKERERAQNRQDYLWKDLKRLQKAFNDVYGDMSPLTSLAAALPPPASSSVPAPAESLTRSFGSTAPVSSTYLGYPGWEQIPVNPATPSPEMTARIQEKQTI